MTITMECAKVTSDRAEGRRGNAGINPSAIIFSPDFTPLSDPPRPLELDELRAHAEARGFADGDSQQSEYMLNRISYQHASGYFHMLEDETGRIPDGMSMRTLHRIILFDRKLQSLFMEYIGLFELQFRAQYSYRLSIERGAFAHRERKNFKNRNYFKSFLQGYQKEFRRQIKNRNRTVSEAYEKYGDAPTWIAVEIMSFGTLSMLYGNTRSMKVRDGVAASFGVTQEELVSWARAISGVRNTCAHFGQICGKNLVSRPKRIYGADGDNGSPFYIIMILVKLLGSPRYFPDDTSLSYGLMLVNATVQLFNEFEDILPLCGVSADWRELIMQKQVIGAPAKLVKSPLKITSAFRRITGRHNDAYITAVDNKGKRTKIRER